MSGTTTGRARRGGKQVAGKTAATTAAPPATTKPAPTAARKTRSAAAPAATASPAAGPATRKASPAARPTASPATSPAATSPATATASPPPAPAAPASAAHDLAAEAQQLHRLGLAKLRDLLEGRGPFGKNGVDAAYVSALRLALAASGAVMAPLGGDDDDAPAGTRRVRVIRAADAPGTLGAVEAGMDPDDGA